MLIYLRSNPEIHIYRYIYIYIYILPFYMIIIVFYHFNVFLFFFNTSSLGLFNYYGDSLCVGKLKLAVAVIAMPRSCRPYFDGTACFLAILKLRKGTTKLHLMHYLCVVIILFITDLYKSAFSTYSLRKNLFFVLLRSVSLVCFDLNSKSSL